MIDTIGIPEALQSLRPKAEWSLINDTDLNWHDKKQTEPTKAEIDTEIIRLQAEFSSQEYARNRASATGYPSIPDQLDEIYHNGIDSWKAVIKVTKDKYPKG